MYPSKTLTFLARLLPLALTTVSRVVVVVVVAGGELLLCAWQFGHASKVVMVQVWWQCQVENCYSVRGGLGILASRRNFNSVRCE